MRATKEHIGDLLVDDLGADNGKLRSAIEATLKLADQGVVMVVGDEYRLQTARARTGTGNSGNGRPSSPGTTAIQFGRDQLLYAEADRIMRSLRLTQGASKSFGNFPFTRPDAPALDGASIPLWMRDGWSCHEGGKRARRARPGSTAQRHVFLPRQPPMTPTAHRRGRGTRSRR